MRDKIKAWWLRNVKYRDKTFEYPYLGKSLKLFEILTAREGSYYIYLGKGKFIQTKNKII